MDTFICWITFICLPLACAQVFVVDPRLVGTWSTKSNSTFTGPTFYDPSKDRLIEPNRTGISFSFTKDGHWESSYFRAISNPVQPNCPSAMMQWQHGSYTVLANESLALQPILEDGRQLMSSPCLYQTAIYTTYNQSMLFKWFEVLIDPYHQIPRLNLYEFDGSPLPPLYKAFSIPIMNPTTTLAIPLPSKNITNPPNSKRQVQSSSIINGTFSDSVLKYITSDMVWAFSLGSVVVGVASIILGYFLCNLSGPRKGKKYSLNVDDGSETRTLVGDQRR